MSLSDFVEALEVFGIIDLGLINFIGICCVCAWLVNKAEID